jgi:hypothetical protein
MKISKLPLFAATLPLAATLFLLPAPVDADTYQIFNLGSDDGYNIVGIDTSGEVVIFNGITPEYFTYANGVLVDTTSTLPSLTYDDGTPCSEPAGFGPSGKVICNNGRIGFGSRFNTNGYADGVYAGPTSSLTLIQPGGTTDTVVLNSSGDFAWSNGIVEDNFEAIDLTSEPNSLLLTPEPKSLLLVGTGCIFLFCVLCRKLS